MSSDVNEFLAAIQARLTGDAGLAALVGTTGMHDRRAVIAMAAPLVKHVGVEMGLAEQAGLADALAALAGALGGVLAIYGRIKATRSIGPGAGRN